MFACSLPRALKDSGVILKSEDSTERSRDQHGRGSLKAHFCTGINNVTRTLERIPKQEKKGISLSQKLATSMASCEEAPAGSPRGKPIKLQAIIVAMDVQPKILVSHIGELCMSRGIPMVSIIGGDGMGSLRLGKTLGLRTATVIGVKAGSSPINAALQAILKK
ncbi:hypothetical protein AXG93_1406s1170 [Marchantia polymorpha subsp. ruderalis]|uniref:Ribosomal protein L7Ae/L30e/S12e/Gadd45 domain-containing protein n=1 Tax=Marchantia polymorpha subsp. ruderalis TaxID=1480154 RepID=A0A176W213_MARPO|nr:hypothetical protein AXG93_1406s1170 [Marchantia polymorpha subsp. ruderalis]